MGCPSGVCPVETGSSHEDEPDEDAVMQLVSDLAAAGSVALRDGDACCAFCADIVLDSCEPPAHAREMIAQGRACPLSVIGYKAAYAAKQGKEVVLESNGSLPRLLIDGVEVDPLNQYRVGKCEKGAC